MYLDSKLRFHPRNIQEAYERASLIVGNSHNFEHGCTLCLDEETEFVMFESLIDKECNDDRRPSAKSLPAHPLLQNDHLTAFKEQVGKTFGIY